MPKSFYIAAVVVGIFATFVLVVIVKKNKRAEELKSLIAIEEENPPPSYPSSDTFLMRPEYTWKISEAGCYVYRKNVLDELMFKHNFIGKTKQEIIDILGEDESVELPVDKEFLIYFLDCAKNESLFFDFDKAHKADLVTHTKHLDMPPFETDTLQIAVKKPRKAPR